MNTFNPPARITFPDSTAYPDQRYFDKALADLDVYDKVLADENTALNQELADLNAQVEIAQRLLLRNQNHQTEQADTRAFIVSRQPTSTPPTDAAPVIQSVTTPTADGTKAAGDPITVALVFDKPVNVTGTPQVTLSDGSIVDYGGGTGSTSILFPYTVQPGNTTGCAVLAVTSVNLNGGSINDASATPANLALPATATLGSIVVSA